MIRRRCSRHGTRLGSNGGCFECTQEIAGRKAKPGREGPKTARESISRFRAMSRSYWRKIAEPGGHGTAQRRAFIDRAIDWAILALLIALVLGLIVAVTLPTGGQG